MEELMEALQAAESSMKNFDRELRQTKKELILNKDTIKPMKRPTSSGLIDLNSAKKPVQKSSPSIAFAKSQRFRTPNPDLDSSMESTSTVESNTSLSAVKTRSPAMAFGKTKRFQETSKINSREFDLNPNYDYIKKKESSPVIKPPSSLEPKVRIIKKLQKAAGSPQKGQQEQYLNDESIETVKLEDMERGTCGISDILSDTTEILGPGAYEVKWDGVEARKSVGFPKAARFRKAVEEAKSELNPKYSFVKKSVPGVKLVPETKKNEKLLKKKKEEEYYNEIRNQMRNNAPLEKDVALRKNIPGVAMRNEMDFLSEEERLHRIFSILDKRREERRVAPGTYEPQPLDEPICTVVYRKSLSPKVLRLPERPPSPTRYYAKDDLTKPSQPAFSFVKEGIDKTPKLEDFDMRKPLDINLNLVKPRIPNAILLPEHKYEEDVPDLTEVKIGPGAYELVYDLTEKRTDIGVLKFADLNENNMRENQMDLAQKDIFDADLDPNYDVTKPRAPGFVYHKPVELEGPAHLPDSVLKPEQWKFYDANLEAVKPEVGDIEFAGGLTKEQFKEKEDLFNEFLAHQARKVKKPEVGQYDVKYTGVDPDERVPDFTKYQERDMEVIDKEEVDIPGDILILNPERPQPHLPNIKFESMLGRKEDDKLDQQEQTEELLLNPTYDLVKPRTITLVDLSKQQDRKGPYEVKTDENQEELLLDVNYNAVDPKIKGIPDLSKLTSREDLEPRKNEEREEIVLNPSHALVKPDTSHTISMNSKTKRFVEPGKEETQEGQVSTMGRIDYEKTLDATKPDKNVVDFDRYAVREATKDTQNEKKLKKQLSELNKRIQKSKLPVIEEEKFEKYPNEENQDPQIMEKDRRKSTRRDSRPIKPIKQEGEKGEVQEGGVEGRDDIEPWENQ